MSKKLKITSLANLCTDYYLETLYKPSLSSLVRMNAIIFKIDSICAEFPEWQEPARKLLFEL